MARAFEAYPPAIRRQLLVPRRLVFEVAANSEGVGELEETLTWGEPAYITAKTKSGSTVRIACKKSSPTQYAMYFHCQTNLIETFRMLFPKEFKFEGNRALIFEEAVPIPVEALKLCITAALTYHRNKGGRANAVPTNADA